MKVGLFGFGRTGRLVADEIIKDKDCTLSWVVRATTQNNHDFASDLLGYPQLKEGRFFTKEEALAPNFFETNPVDAIIDFSSSQAVYEYAHAAKLDIRIVSAISHYEPKELDFFKGLSTHTAVLHSANITLGINFLLVASQVLQQIVPHADIEIVEEHFREKKNVSGSALKLADKLGLDPVTHVNSIRVGGILGKHEVVFGLPNQTIRLTHDVISRGAFATGALFAARYLMGAPKGFYNMEDIMRETFIEKISVDRILV